MAFVPAHSWVGERDAPGLVFVLHGVLGSGSNFRSFARRLYEAHSDHGFVLVDLRLHGASLDAPPPHTLAACADDLAALANELGRAPRVIAGHSFGGKVALEYARRHGSELAQLWVLDADPGPRAPGADSDVMDVLDAAERLPMPATSRSDVVAALATAGIGKSTANWLAMNLDRDDRGYSWSIPFDKIRELLDDYFAADLWPFLERSPELPDMHLVVAERSDRLSPELRRRAAEIAERRSNVSVHVLPDSGHWVHVDNPDGLLEIMSSRLA